MRFLISILTRLRQSPVLTLVALVALGVPLIPAPVTDPRWHGIRTAAFEAGAAVVLVFLLARFWTREDRKNWAEAFQALPLRFLLALLGWGCLSAFLAPAKPFAVQGLLQLGAGALIALSIAAEARTRPRYEILLHALTGATLLISLSGFALFGQNSSPLAVGFYQDHQLYGAVFTLLLLLMLALSLSHSPSGSRLPTQAALLAGSLALGLSQTRASWVGVTAAAIMFFALLLWTRITTSQNRSFPDDRRRLPGLLPTLAVAGACLYCLSVSPWTGPVAARMRTLLLPGSHGQNNSLAWRLQAWQGARRMIRQKPLLGWGIGGYPYYQQAFTLQGDTPALVRSHGPKIPDEAHNLYLQITAEMGVPGLLLWVGVLISTFTLGVSALRRFTPGGLRQRMLIGCLSALTGQAVDAVANPAWLFGEVSLFLWIVLGLTVALSLPVPPRADSRPEFTSCLPIPIGRQLVKTAAVLAVGGGLLWLIFRTLPALPAPTL